MVLREVQSNDLRINSNEERHMSQTITMKHMMADARDCTIEWEADFDKMALHIRAGFISPELLLGFLRILAETDDRFAKTKIIGALEICKRFDVCLCLPSGATFNLKSYLPPLTTEPEFELFEVEKK